MWRLDTSALLGQTRLMRALFVGLVLALVTGCKPPPDALVTRCETVFFAANDARSCTVAVERFADKPALAALRTESRNFKVHVKLSLTLAAGEVQASLRGGEGVVWTSTLTPGAPAAVEADVALNRNTQSFTLELAPLRGAPSGLTGTVEHHAI